MNAFDSGMPRELRGSVQRNSAQASNSAPACPPRQGNDASVCASRSHAAVLTTAIVDIETQIGGVNRASCRAAIESKNAVGAVDSETKRIRSLRGYRDNCGEARCFLGRNALMS